MGFELLDNILLESGQRAIYVQENKKVNESEKVLNEASKGDVDPTNPDLTIVKEEKEYNVDSMYADLDQLIEDTMKTSLRTTISESTLPSETKVEHLTIVEKAVFTKDQMTSFIEENVDPILRCAGVFNGTYNLGGDNPIAVSLPIYETALILKVANDGLLESTNVEDDDKTIKNSLYESLMESQQVEKDNSKSIEIVNEHLAGLYERYDITEDNDREALFNEAVHITNKYGADNLRPSFNELAECICNYNVNAERKDEKLFGEMIPKDIELSESENVFIRALNNINKSISGLVPQSVKDKFKNVSENTVVNDNSSTIAIANTATGLSSMVAWKEGASESLEKAFNEAINVIKAQANSCKNTNNVQICEACNKKLEEKWEIESKSLEEIAASTVKKIAGAASGAVGGTVGGNLGVRINKEYRKLKAESKNLQKEKDEAKPEEKEKIQAQIDDLKNKMKDMRKKATKAGVVIGAAAGAITS